MITMSSSLRRLTPRALTPAWKLPRSYQQPGRFFRAQPAPTRFLRQSGLAFTKPLSKNQLRNSSTDASEVAKSTESLKTALPTCCPGCGAYAQTVEPNEPGYYGKTRKQTKKKLRKAQNQSLKEPTWEEAANALDEASEEMESAPKPLRRYLSIGSSFYLFTNSTVYLDGALIDSAADTAGQYLIKSKASVQVCDRCHDLLHHNEAVSAISPTIHSISAYLGESPYKHNRIYHIIDAADFPMSLVDGIYEELSIQGQRSRNRRSATEKYKHGRKLPTISFVITRSDLLAPTSKQTDSKMQYIRSILREKLKIPEDVRMGNVHMISAHRGWWTKQVKEEMEEHGGGIWIVGKINAGKSSFVEACIPKDSRNLEKMAELVARRAAEESAPHSQSKQPDLDPDSLLPPAPREDLYPVLPVVSSLPGTTVSPIRIPFGRGRGEVIDLPGLDRGSLDNHVQDKYKRDLIMTKRRNPERHNIKPGQSLVLGGTLVRITPTDPQTIVTAACFVPLDSHLTSTDKAVKIQAGELTPRTEDIAKPGTQETISLAGVFDLKWDVTRSNLPKSIAKVMKDKGSAPAFIPYRVMAADILIEGCGWIELTAQIRAKPSENRGELANSFPQVEVFTPEGKHVASRQPFECWKFVEQKLNTERQNLRHRRSIGWVKRTGYVRRMRLDPFRNIT